MACLSSEDQRTQLAWTENRIHLDFLASLVQKKFDTFEFWIGIDDRDDDGLWETR